MSENSAGGDRLEVEGRMATGCGADFAPLAKALGEIAEGRVGVRLEPGGASPEIEDLKRTINSLSARLDEAVGVAHGLTVGLAEHFEVLQRVRSGDLDARIEHVSPHEILEYSRELTNSTLERLADEIRTRRKAQGELANLAAAVEQSAGGIVITDDRGLVEYVNPAYIELSGYTRSELIGAVLRYEDRLGDRHTPEFKEMIRIAMAGNVWRGNLMARRKDGRLIATENIVWPVRDDGGNLSKFVIIMRDITGEMEIRSRLDQSRKLEALGTLSGGITHELNNILTPIIGYAELVLEDVEEMPQIKKNVNRILAASERAREILWKILAFARSEELEATSINGSKVARVVEDAIDLFAATIPASIGVDFENQLGEEDTVAAGATQLHQVLLNLAMNAVAAMPDREGVITITAREPSGEALGKFLKDSEASHFIEVVVADTGSGIPAEKIDRIFDPFFTTKPVGQGTGLGLSVVHGIVRNCGGFITVDSTLGEGTRFHIYLPRVEPGGRGADASSQARQAIRGGMERVLLVDDEEAVVNVFRLQLEGLGYMVDAFTSPTSALAAFMRNPKRYDLLLTDHSMPMMSGVALASEARLVRPELPVIICTGFSNAITFDERAELGVIQILDKPVMLRELASAVRQNLDAAARNSRET